MLDLHVLEGKKSHRLSHFSTQLEKLKKIKILHPDRHSLISCILVYNYFSSSTFCQPTLSFLLPPAALSWKLDLYSMKGASALKLCRRLRCRRHASPQKCNNTGAPWLAHLVERLSLWPTFKSVLGPLLPLSPLPFLSIKAEMKQQHARVMAMWELCLLSMACLCLPLQVSDVCRDQYFRVNTTWRKTKLSSDFQSKQSCFHYKPALCNHSPLSRWMGRTSCDCMEPWHIQ